MSKKVKTLIIFFIVAIDQLIKFWVQKNILPGEEKKLVLGVISLTNIKNSGAAWSLWEGKLGFS